MSVSSKNVPGGARTPATSGKSLKTRKRAESASSKSTKSNTSAKKTVRVAYAGDPTPALHDDWWEDSGEYYSGPFVNSPRTLSRIGFRAGYRAGYLAAIAALKGGAK